MAAKSTEAIKQLVVDESRAVERVLVITAHPDDLDFGAAGTIAKLADNGVEVSYCICTNGDAGGFDPTVPRENIPGIRQGEQRDAAKVLGADESNIHFLGYQDGALTVTLELRKDISRVIRQVRPDRVLVQSPERNYDRIYASHPDHLAAGEAALCAVYPDARNPFAHIDLAKEGHEAWETPEVWLMASTDDANHAVDTTDYFERKLDALLAHVSQTEHMGRGGLQSRIGEWNRTLAQQFDLGEERYAEAFRVIDTR